MNRAFKPAKKIKSKHQQPETGNWKLLNFLCYEN